jgi:hypothetical protein
LKGLIQPSDLIAFSSTKTLFSPLLAMTEQYFPLYMFWISLLILVCGVSVVGLVRYRESSFIRVRGVWSIVSQLICITSFGVLLSLKGAFDAAIPFNISAPIVNFLLFLNIVFVFERTTMLVIRFRISTECVQRAQVKFHSAAAIHSAYLPRSDFEKRLYPWFLHHRQLFHMGPFSRSKLISWAIAILTDLPIILGAWLCSEDTLQVVANITAIAFGIFSALWALIFAYFLKPVKENFKIKKELNLTAYLAIIALTCLVSFASITSKRPGVLQRSIYSIFALCKILLSGSWIAFLSFKKANIPYAFSSSHSSEEIVETNHPAYSNLLQVLGDEKLRPNFEEFLIREFAVEELLFWSAVQKFKGQPAEKRWSMGEEIFNEFCSVDAKLCVNISAQARADLIETFKSNQNQSENLSSTVFDAAAKEVLQLLALDSFARFSTQIKPQVQMVEGAINSTQLEEKSPS